MQIKSSFLLIAMDQSASSESSNHSMKPIFVLLLAVVVDLLGFGLVIPILPFWTTKVIGASELMYGLLLSSFSLFQFIFAPVWGRISDRRGRRPVILIGLLGSVLGYGLLTITALFFQTSLLLLFVSRFVQGTFTAATLPTSQAYISDTTPPGPERTRGYGLLGAAFGFGFAIGPALGGILTGLAELVLPSIRGYWAPALFATLLAVINLLAAIRNLPEPVRHSSPAPNTHSILPQSSLSALVETFVKNPVLVVVILLFAVVSLSFSSMQSTLVLLGEVRFGLDETGAGIMFLIIGVVTIVVQGRMIGPLSKKYDDTLLIVTSLIFLIIAFTGISTVQSFLVTVLWVIPLGIGVSVSNPTMNALLSKETPQTQQGSILGINQGLASLMRIIGPIFGTLLFEMDVVFPYVSGVVLLGLSFIMSLGLMRLVSDAKLQKLTAPMVELK